jgi:hypothetical protein
VRWSGPPSERRRAGCSSSRERKTGPEKLEEVDADTSHSVVTGYITLARVSQAQGDAEGALEALHKVRQVAQSPRLSPLRKDQADGWAEA